MATNMPGVTTAPPPPLGFDPVTASDAALEQYGFPPRPDPRTDPDGYADWSHAMSRAIHRVYPRLLKTNIKHGPFAAQNGGDEVWNINSTNWSGYLKSKSVSPANPGFTKIVADYVVPRAVNASCDGGTDYAAAWVGLDGYSGIGASDVFQAGTDSNATCSGGLSSENYYAWYEWYPASEVPLDPATFPVSPGDDLYIVVWSTSPTAGHASFTDLNTGDNAEDDFSPPVGTTLYGNSAEWIVEAPTVNGVKSTLADYALDYFSAGSATYGTSTVIPKQGIPIVLVPQGASQPVSIPSLLGTNAILFTYP